MFLLYGDMAFFLKLGESTRDSFQFEAEVAADFLACHAQLKFGVREAASGEAL